MVILHRKIVNSLPLSLRKKLPKKIVVAEINMKESRRLNRIYRDKDDAANVLSFRYGPDYGEILVCPEIIRREAKKQGNTYKYQMTWMVLHGMIHLAGVHHEQSQKVAIGVENMEQKLLHKLFPAK